MILAFEIILLVIMVISFMGAVADDNKELRKSMTSICIATIIGLVASFIIL